ncbi:MAG TPA: MMPL family transporter [Thermoanaerobaculia bacterium]|nr:MMPL family transporter [Thermoanaerobaculia bacterium]
MTDKLLDALARFCLRRSGRIIAVSVVVAIIAVAAASRLRFDPDLLNLIPQKNRQVNEFRKVLQDMGTIDYHIVAVELPAGRDVHDYDTLIDAIADGYRKDPRIEDVTYKVPNPLDFVQTILPRALLLLTPAELQEAAVKLSDEGIRESVARNRALLETPQSMALKQVVQYDPFNFAPIFLKKFQAASGGMHLDTSSGYYLSADHSVLLILAKPKRPAQDVPFAKALLTDSALMEARALADFQKNAPPQTPLPKIEHTGGYTIATSDADLIREDVIINVVGSFFGVLALFIYAFRRAASVVYAGAPLAMGLALTFGTAGAVYGVLSQASAGFAALLAGLGIDFITVLYGRYVDERNRGAMMPASIKTMMHSTLAGVVLAAITTAGTFFAFLATDFRGMTQLGFLTGTGILLFLLCVVFLLPALIVFSERDERKRAPKLYLHSFGAGHLIDISIRRPRVTLLVWIIFIVVCGALSTQIKFSDNIQDLRAGNNAGVKTQAYITSKFGQSFDFMMYVCEGKSLDDVMARSSAATADLEALVADHTIGSIQSLATFLPPPQQQAQVIAEMQRGASDRFNAARITKTFKEALVANGFRAEAYDSYLELFTQSLQPKEPVTLANLGNPDLTKLATRFVKPVNGGWMSVIYVYPSGGRWPREVPPKLLAVPDRHPGDILTGVNLVSSTLRRIVMADARRATIIGFLAVAVLMFLSFRTLKMTALTFVPFVAGAVGMLGLMALMGLQFNFMNIFVGLMIVGVATDYAIYMLQRYRENPAIFPSAAHETGKAILMAVLTAIVGYGSFAFSHYPGLRSIGYASFFGIGLSGLAAITLLPAILVMGDTNHDQGQRHDSLDPQ